MFYAPVILQKFFGEKESIIGTFVLNAINFFATFITIYAVERFGRAKLLVSGGLVMMFSLIINAVLSSIDESRETGYVVVAFSATFVIGFAYS